MPEADALRAVFEDGLTYREKTPANKERHMKAFTELVAAKDREIAAARLASAGAPVGGAASSSSGAAGLPGAGSSAAG